MLQRWLYPQIQQDRDDFIFEQDVASPHFHPEVLQYLIGTISGRWIGRGGQHDLVHLKSPDLTPCDFVLWGYIKETVYVPPTPAILQDLRDRIGTALSSINIMYS
ncbi:hypothetical protein AVEN_136858-1 [Araneus ventricosus]|uniref:Uncharacterized protein n=1 Tax=Araneus ventricosus TaxID=182803 RepID=A0A4Y2G1N5_ARAVE|nr:hypothetical protein AVEN_136858-1 [Araneus ventricosus]